MSHVNTTKKKKNYTKNEIDIEPTKHINFHKRALTYLVKNQYWKAVRDWGKAIKIDSTFKSVIHNLLDLSIHHQKYSQIMI